MKLENWSLIVSTDPYRPPEQMTIHLHGNVFGNKQFPDGLEIKTSSVMGKRNGKAVTKSGSEYELGEVNPRYEREYPNAKERFFVSAKEIPKKGRKKK